MDARVPITSSDELGELAASFNEMMKRPLRAARPCAAALGSYVDPEVAKRVLEEGELLEGEEREVTVMFVDVRDFTPRAEQSSARETVAFLNEFFDDGGAGGAASTGATRTSSWATACWRCSARRSACPITRTAPWRARGPSAQPSGSASTERSGWASGSIPDPSWWAPWGAAEGSSSR